jgi:hypothetical protein
MANSAESDDFDDQGWAGLAVEKLAGGKRVDDEDVEQLCFEGRPEGRFLTGSADVNDYNPVAR